jgi:RTX calcium-binding nonapeptide repeat (4 copies)
MASSHTAQPASTLVPRRLVAVLAAACALFAAAGGAPSAHAAVSCQFNSGGALTIQSSAVLDDAWIVRSGDYIVVKKSLQTPVACAGGPATVHNTHVIAFADNSGGDGTFEIDLRGGPFAPGQTDEPGNTDEIDIQALMGEGTDDRLYMWGGPANDFWRLGRTAVGTGVNLNAGLEGQPGEAPNVDVDLRAAEMAVLMSGPGDDHVLANGGPEFLRAFPERIDVNGDEGNDVLAGGNGPDNFTEGPGNDRVNGGADNDSIIEWGPTAGDDSFEGGSGIDSIGYGDFTAPMRVDLRMTGRQDTGAAGRDALSGFEQASTSQGSDVLIGTNGDNWLWTGDGNDVIAGMGGNDRIDGGGGNDTASYATPPAGVRQGVTVDLTKAGSDQDTGGAGIDWLSGVQNVIGSPFADTLTGNQADNRFEVRDGSRDRVTCSAGTDTVVADVAGTDAIGSGCEAVQLDFRPDTRIDRGPRGLTRDRTPSFRFSSTKPGARFECSLDGDAFAACRSAHTLGRLTNGAHVLRVRSRDMLGARDPSPSERAFSVDATPPRISRARISANGALRFRLSEAATVKIAIRRSGHVTRVIRRGRRGANRVTLRHRLWDRVSLTARDRAGNRARVVRPLAG